jgi:uncharacterized protein (DUF58 family)
MLFRHAEPTPGAPGSGTHSSQRVLVSSRDLIGLRQVGSTLPLKAIKSLSPGSGNLISRFKGRGMEFDEARPYEPGDDVRNLDWRVMARTGKPHTKLFREERERSVLLWVDYRAPMRFATRGSFKSVLAARAAAMLAWSAIGHGDRLGGLIFSEHTHFELRPKRGKRAVLDFIHNLADNQPTEQSNTDSRSQQEAAAHALARLRRVTRPGSLLFLLSDFRGLNETGEAHLTQLAKHNELVLLFLYDQLEQELPPPGRYRISNGARSLALNTADQKTREAYSRTFQGHRHYLSELCRRTGMHLLSCATDQDLQLTLQQGLGRIS